MHIKKMTTMNKFLLKTLGMALCVTTLSVNALPANVAHKPATFGFGNSFLQIAEGPFGVDEISLRHYISTRVAELAEDLKLSGGMLMKINSLEPTRIVISKDGFKEDVIRNAIVLVEGDLTTNLIQNSIVVVKGKIRANDIRGSVVASSENLDAYHVGGRDQEALVLSKKQIHVNATYSATIVAEEGAKIQSPTYTVAINTKVRTPHPTRITYEYVRKNVLSNLPSFLSAR